MPYCPNCGKELSEDSVHCPNCGNRLNKDSITYRRQDYEKNEKNEKDEKGEKDRDEKNEKDEKGEKHEDPVSSAVMGGLIVVWLGLSFLLRELGYFVEANWIWIFMAGVGVILVFRGLLCMAKGASWQGCSGYFIGGILVGLIGLANIVGYRDWWPILLIVIGAFIIINAIIQRSRHPRP